MIRKIRGFESNNPSLAVAGEEDKDRTTNHTNHTNEENEEIQSGSDSPDPVRGIRGSTSDGSLSGVSRFGARRSEGRLHSGSSQVHQCRFLEDRFLAAAGQARRPQGTLDQLPALFQPRATRRSWSGGPVGITCEQATALVAYYDARKREGWDSKRLTPLLAGLDQLLPWIHQWHPEIDREFGETAGQSFQTMLEHDAHELGLTLEDIRNWEPPATARKARTTCKKKVAGAEDDDQ